MLPGPYRVPAYRAIGHFRLTNKTPAATYRAPGRYEGTFARERIMDAIAQRLGIDPIEVRRVNLIAKNEMPFRRPLTTLDEETVYDSGDYAGLLDKALKALDWAGLNAGVRQRRAKGEAVGVGLAIFVEKSGIGPADGVKVSVDTSGAVEVLTGGASLGQGFETAMAQICADALGVDYHSIRVIHGRTDLIAHGIGAHSSRASVMTGSATHIAATKVREKALEVASELLQTPVEDLDVVNGAIVRKGAAGPSISLAEIARTIAPTSKARGQHEPGLSAEGWFFTNHMVYPYGIHIVVAKVDRETGEVAIERYMVAYDLGLAINPTMVEGQIAGGVAQGMGGALFEEFVYDGRGEPLSLTFADYLIPTCAEMPAVDVLIAEDAPSPRNPLGLKGAGEAGTNAAGAAIAAAIDDAIGIPGVITALPVTPQRLKQMLDRHQSTRTPFCASRRRRRRRRAALMVRRRAPFAILL
jgi:CO/xanthine dehydrogenase Mo-binding subunit